LGKGNEGDVDFCSLASFAFATWVSGRPVVPEADRRPGAMSPALLELSVRVADSGLSALTLLRRRDDDFRDVSPSIVARACSDLALA
jgi:hypothetical protein